MIPVISIVGKSNIGKTTLIEKLIPEFKKQGYKIAVIKHDAHGFEIDHPGKDSYRHAQAGADLVIISSPNKLALIKKLKEEFLIRKLIKNYVKDVDLIITEGFKRQNFPKIEVYRKEIGDNKLLCKEKELLALVTNFKFKINAPQFKFNEIKKIVNLIKRKFLD